MSAALQSLVMAESALETRLCEDVRSAARGDRDAYGRIVDGTRNVVTSIALAIVRDVPTSEDVAQEVYLHAWRGLSRLRNPASFLPWLRQLTRNRAHDELRRRGVRAGEPLGEQHIDARPDARAQLIAVEERRALAEALGELPDAAREVVTLYYREDRSVAQVAELLGLSEVAVKKRLSRAREELRAATLERLGDTMAKSAPAAAFTAAVLGALTAGAPATAAAAVLGRSGALLGKSGALVGKSGALALAGKLAGLLVGSLGGALGGALGVVSGMRKVYARARDEEERRALRRFTIVNVALVIFGAFAMPFGHWLWPGVGLVLGFGSFWTPMMYGYLIRLPRIVSRREAQERQEDPGAAARQRRERRLSLVGCLFGSLAGWGTVVFVLWRLR